MINKIIIETKTDTALDKLAIDSKGKVDYELEDNLLAPYSTKFSSNFFYNREAFTRLANAIEKIENTPNEEDASNNNTILFTLFHDNGEVEGKYFKTSIESFPEIKKAILIIKKNLTSSLGGIFAEPDEQ